MKRMLRGVALAFVTSCAIAQAPPGPPTPPPPLPPLAIVGGTIVDLSGYGKRTNDLADQVILTKDDRIVAVGKRGEIEIPKGAKIIDAKGKFIVPGYIDGFSTQNNEAYARAHLYMGVTTIFANDRDPRRGATMPVPGGPSHETIGIATGYDLSKLTVFETNKQVRESAPRLSPEEMRWFIRAKAWDATRALVAYYTLDKPQLEATVAAARERGVILIGELGLTSYLDAARAGVPIFVHANRYLLDLAPADIRAEVADDSFGPGRQRYMQHLGEIDPDSDAVKSYGRELAKHRVALMPTFALMGPRLPNHPNPWREKVASILDPADVMPGIDPKSGDRTPSLEAMDERARMVAGITQNVLAINATLAKQGAKFVVGSGSDAFGVLPGVGVHTEMRMLVDIGLTPREALAAATTNWAVTVDALDFGKLAPGARADVLVLDADPTHDIANARRIGTLVLRGAVVDRAALLEKPLEIPVM